MGKRILGWFCGLIVFFFVVGVAMMPLEEESVAEQIQQHAVQTSVQTASASELTAAPTVLSETISIPPASEPVKESEESSVSESTELLAIDSEEKAADSVIQVDYILNTNSGKFHYPSCPSVDLMNESNKCPYEGDREGAIEQGYVPCLNCNP